MRLQDTASPFSRSAAMGNLNNGAGVSWVIDRNGGIGRKRTQGDGQRPIEPVVLKNDDRTRFPGIVGTSGNAPYFASFHVASQSATDSMKARSSCSCALLAIANDWRRA